MCEIEKEGDRIMKKDKEAGSMVSVGNSGTSMVHATTVRRTTTIFEEETVFEYVSNEHMYDRLMQYAIGHKKHR